MDDAAGEQRQRPNNGPHQPDDHAVQAWKHAAGTGRVDVRCRRLAPYISRLFDLHLGPAEPMTDKELGRRWRALLHPDHLDHLDNPRAYRLGVGLRTPQRQAG